MKFITILFLACIFAYSQQTPVSMAETIRQRIEEDKENCIKESGVDPNLVAQLHQNRTTDNHNAKCFIKCFHTKMGGMSETGELIKPPMPSTPGPISRPPINEDELNAAIQKCNALTGSDPCDKAYQAVNCLFQNIPSPFNKPS